MLDDYFAEEEAESLVGALVMTKFDYKRDVVGHVHGVYEAPDVKGPERFGLEVIWHDADTAKAIAPGDIPKTVLDWWSRGDCMNLGPATDNLSYLTRNATNEAVQCGCTLRTVTEIPEFPVRAKDLTS